MTNLVVGLGTGRCGTHSLAHLLDAQDNAHVTHEQHIPLLWANDSDPLRHFSAPLPVSLFGDVGFYYLPYVERIWESLPDVRFVCLQRGRSDTIASFQRYIRMTAHGSNWFQSSGLPNQWDRSFPTFDEAISRTEAIGRYWDEYYAEAGRLAADDRFTIRPMWHLNFAAHVYDILSFCGVSNPRILHPKLEATQ